MDQGWGKEVFLILYVLHLQYIIVWYFASILTSKINSFLYTYLQTHVQKVHSSTIHNTSKMDTQIAYQQYEWINKPLYIHTILYDNDNKPLKTIKHNLDLSHRDAE